MKWFRKSKIDDVTAAHLDIVKLFSNIFSDLTEFMMSVSENIGKQQFHEALGRLSSFYSYTNLIEESMKLYYNKYILTFIESGAVLSHSSEDIRVKEKKVLHWITVMNNKCDELMQTIRGSNEPNVILEKYIELQNEFTNHKSLNNYINALRTCVLEYRMHEKDKLIENDELKYIFNRIKLNPNITEATKRLFLKGEYEASIFEAYKEVEEKVRKKSNVKDMYGKKLMSHVFNVKSPILKIQDLNPLQQQNKQEGLHFLFMGAISTMKNPLSHRVTKKMDPYLALHHLTFASILLYNLDLCKKVN